MSFNKTICSLLFLSAFSFQPSAFSAMPQPSCIFYGQAKDDFGWPLTADAAVILRINGTEIVRHNVSGSLAPGVNFVLRAPLDDGRGTAYRTASAIRGQQIEIVVLHNGVEKTILETNALPSVGAPGSILPINVTAGVDANQNNMPDFWDEVLVYFSDGALTNINQVVGGDDFDGDGQSNWEEYLAGTLAFLADDFFGIDSLARAGGAHAAMRFLSTAGKIYRAYAAPTALVDGHWAWSNTTFAATADEPAQNTCQEGNGQWIAVYLAATNAPQAIRMSVE